MTCNWCGRPLAYVHGHAACLDGDCAMFGLNQAECCSGETAAAAVTPPPSSLQPPWSADHRPPTTAC